MSKAFLSGILAGYFAKVMQRQELKQRRVEVEIQRKIDEARLQIQRDAEAGQMARFREGLGEEARQFNEQDINRDREFDTSTDLHREDRTSQETMTREELANRVALQDTEGTQRLAEIAANNAPSQRVEQVANIDRQAAIRDRVERRRAEQRAIGEASSPGRSATYGRADVPGGQIAWQNSAAPNQGSGGTGPVRTFAYGGAPAAQATPDTPAGRNSADAAVEIEDMRANERARIRRGFGAAAGV